MLIAVIILGVLCLALIGLVVYFLLRKGSSGPDNSTLLIKQDITQLTQSVTQLKEGLQKELTGHLGRSQEGLLRQFETSNKIVADVSKQLESLKTTNQQVINVTDELKTLQNILTNPKQRGNVGEIHLETILTNILPPGVFQMQYGFKNGETVDAVVFVDKHIVPIDSKFSLENYNRLVEAKDAPSRALHSAEFKKDVKKRIDETAKYIRTRENTTDFAFMFIPSEAIYYDLLVNKVGVGGTDSRNLIEYASRDKKVIITSPTTFLAYLQTVMQGLRGMKIEEQAKEIQQRVGELGRHIAAHEDSMQRLGNSLGATVNHYNKAHKQLQYVDKDIVKIADESAGVEPILLDKPLDGEND
jgi:DNA recombination protein RmuC